MPVFSIPSNDCGCCVEGGGIQLTCCPGVIFPATLYITISADYGNTGCEGDAPPSVGQSFQLCLDPVFCSPPTGPPFDTIGWTMGIASDGSFDCPGPPANPWPVPVYTAFEVIVTVNCDGDGFVHWELSSGEAQAYTPTGDPGVTFFQNAVGSSIPCDDIFPINFADTALCEGLPNFDPVYDFFVTE